jgi:hypothetical protein
MSLDRRSNLLPHRFERTSRFDFARQAAVLGAAALLLSTAQAALATEPADVCPALKQIVAASDFKQSRTAPTARLPGVAAAEDYRTTTNTFDCHWRAHWQADGVINDPLEEMGADIAACLPNVIHDVNTPTRQHFVVTGMDRRVSVTASVVAPNELRLYVTR